MVRLKIMFLIGVALITMYATYAYSKPVTSAKVKILGETSFIEDTIDLKLPIYLIPDVKNNMWILFSDTQKKLLLKNAVTNHKVFLNKDIQDTPSGIVWCITDENKLGIAWRAKSREKSIYFRIVDLSLQQIGQPFEIGKETQPLARLKLGCTNNIINLVWYGEKPDNKGKRYSIYASRSLDGGVTFSDVFDVTPQTRSSIYPSLINDSNGNAYVFTEVVRESKRELILRISTKDGWSEPVSIGEIGTLILAAYPIKIGNRLIVFWFNYYGEVPITETAYSDDGGKTWTRKTLEATRDLDLVSMKAVAGDEQNLYLVLSGVNIKETQQNPRQAKTKLIFLYSHDGGKTFSDPVYIRHDPFGSYTRANFPHITARGKDVVVVWNDYRNIRSNLYMNYSTDGGVTWQSQDIPLEEPGKFNTAVHWETNNLIESEGKYYILAHRFTDDSKEKAYPVLISFKIEK